MSYMLNEQELARLCSEKNRQAEDELYRRYAGRLFTLCRRYSRSRDEAEDLLHDALIKAFDRMSSFHGGGSLYAWLCRITVNMAVDNLRKRRLHFMPMDLSVAETVPEPAEEELAGISQETLLEMISGLPDTQRAVFNMFCIDGYSHKEIAELLGISEKGSAGLLAKARLRLKKKVSEYLKNSE